VCEGEIPLEEDETTMSSSCTSLQHKSSQSRLNSSLIFSGSSEVFKMDIAADGFNTAKINEI
jgi:hypothetical protein